MLDNMKYYVQAFVLEVDEMLKFSRNSYPEADKHFFGEKKSAQIFKNLKVIISWN